MFSEKKHSRFSHHLKSVVTFQKSETLDVTKQSMSIALVTVHVESRIGCLFTRFRPIENLLRKSMFL